MVNLPVYELVVITMGVSGGMVIKTSLKDLREALHWRLRLRPVIW